MGTKYSSQSTSGYNSSPPPDDGTQVASNLVTWAGVKTKLADVLKTFGEAINTALVSALDLSARSISSNDTAIASDHWKTLQVTGTTTIQLSSAASMAAGYEVGVFNAGVGVVTVTPAGSDTLNGASASITVPIKGTMIFRTNQALTGYNIVAQSNSAQTLALSGTLSSQGSTPNTAFIDSSNGQRFFALGSNASTQGLWTWISYKGDGTSSLTALGLASNGTIGLGATTPSSSGSGVSFPATQSASSDANTLDDYEEGTWVPSVGGTTTYTNQVGTYTKIGRLVYVRCSLNINAIGSGSTTTISGLPFAPAVTGVLSGSVATSATAIVSLTASAATNSTIILTSRTAASASEASNAIFQNSTVFTAAGCYEV